MGGVGQPVLAPTAMADAALQTASPHCSSLELPHPQSLRLPTSKAGVTTAPPASVVGVSPRASLLPPPHCHLYLGVPWSSQTVHLALRTQVWAASERGEQWVPTDTQKAMACQRSTPEAHPALGLTSPSPGPFPLSGWPGTTTKAVPQPPHAAGKDALIRLSCVFVSPSGCRVEGRGRRGQGAISASSPSGL